MAIIDSVIMSRAKGSIGNVTLSTQKGRVIAKQKASIVSNPNTQAQQVQRGKVAKAVLAWQLVGGYVKSGITALLPFASEYNTFTSKNMPLYRDGGFENGAVKGEDLKDSFATLGKLGNINVSSVVIDDDSIDFTLAMDNFKRIAKQGDIIKVLVLDSSSDKVSYTSKVVDTSLLSSSDGSVSISVDNSSLTRKDIYAIWLETADGKNSTTSKFESV